MHETPKELGPNSEKTIKVKWQKFAPIETENSDRNDYIVVLGAFSDGNKIPPLINSKRTYDYLSYSII